MSSALRRLGQVLPLLRWKQVSDWSGSTALCLQTRMLGKKSKSRGTSHPTTKSDSYEKSMSDLEGALDLTKVENKMTKAIEHFKFEMANIRPGRINSAMLDHITIDSPSGKVPIQTLGTVTVKDTDKLLIGLFDAESCPEIVTAIEASPLRLQTQVINEQELLILLPKQTKEQLEELAKIVVKKAEHCKVTVRNARKLGMTEAKKLTSADDRKRGETAVEAMTRSFVNEIDNLAETKQQAVRLNS